MTGVLFISRDRSRILSKRLSHFPFRRVISTIDIFGKVVPAFALSTKRARKVNGKTMQIDNLFCGYENGGVMNSVPTYMPV
jgi:hypothetical protein